MALSPQSLMLGHLPRLPCLVLDELTQAGIRKDRHAVIAARRVVINFLKDVKCSPE